ncbi:MAG: metallophosphoesterase [Salinivirgaceae bacterium]|nr:metallophosphoesterase [Salinivirgaceae bacterium]
MWRFLIPIFLIFGGAAFYVFMRFRPLLPDFSSWRGWTAFAAFFTIIFAYVIGSYFQRNGQLIVAKPFIVVGSWAMAVLLYSFLIFLAVDIARLINLLIFKAEWLTFRYQPGNDKGRIFSMVCGAAVAVVIVAGYLNAHFPIRKALTFKTEKNIAEPVRFVLISDVHLGMINSDRYFERLAKRINAENVDFVLIAGDFFDGDPTPVFRSRAAEILKSVNTRYGIFAIPGNHEYIGDAASAMQFMRQNGVNVLCDSAVNLPCGVSILGRDDLSAVRAKGGRSSVEKLVAQADSANYTILLDHQPFHLEEAEQAGIDLQLSGHTHHGQLWPGNKITTAMYECSFGQHRRGNTNYYVSSGYGTWGPPIRTTCHPEMVVVSLNEN